METPHVIHRSSNLQKVDSSFHLFPNTETIRPRHHWHGIKICCQDLDLQNSCGMIGSSAPVCFFLHKFSSFSAKAKSDTCSGASPHVEGKGLQGTKAHQGHAQEGGICQKSLKVVGWINLPMITKDNSEKMSLTRWEQDAYWDLDTVSLTFFLSFR